MPLARRHARAWTVAPLIVLCERFALLNSRRGEMGRRLMGLQRLLHEQAGVRNLRLKQQELGMTQFWKKKRNFGQTQLVKYVLNSYSLTTNLFFLFARHDCGYSLVPYQSFNSIVYIFMLLVLVGHSWSRSGYNFQNYVVSPAASIPP